jgi:membrane protease YdiL (CAAX protease family)
MRENERSFWRLTLKTGILWAIWHYPLMFILYWDQGPAMLLPSLIGFTAGIIAMTYISNFIYERTSSIGLSMLMHALNNTASFVVILLFPKTPFVFLSSVIAWAAVGFLEKRYKIDKKAETQ